MRATGSGRAVLKVGEEAPNGGCQLLEVGTKVPNVGWQVLGLEESVAVGGCKVAGSRRPSPTEAQRSLSSAPCMPGRWASHASKSRASHGTSSGVTTNESSVAPRVTARAVPRPCAATPRPSPRARAS